MHDVGMHLYLDLLKRCLINLIYQDPPIPSPIIGHSDAGFDLDARLRGKDWPSQAHTMIGMKRLDSIQTLVEDILREGIPGDFIETGVGRGGATIFIRGVLKVYGVIDRVVWVADSFEGLPKPRQCRLSKRSYSSPELQPVFSLKQEHPTQFSAMMAQLRQGTSYNEVRENFARYGLLDNHVQFLRGWFCDSLPSAPITQLALLRLDGDLYESTYDALTWLYPKLSVGGYVIVDDYHAFTECRQAVHDYIMIVGTNINLQPIDDDAVFWRKCV